MLAAPRTSDKAVRRMLRRLTRGQLLERTFANVVICPAVSPLFVWRPGDQAPCARKLSEAARRRWPITAQPTEVYWASRLAANLFGSSAGRLSPLEHRGHDLHLAEVYVCFRSQRPQEAPMWRGEDSLPKAGYRQKDPDAFLLDTHGRIRLVVESAGRYGARQVEAFHGHCCERSLPYELW
jgi:hypothetical protein